MDNGGEAGAVPVDALVDTAAGAVASYFQAIRGRNLLVKEPLAKLLRQPLPALENSLKVVIESV